MNFDKQLQHLVDEALNEDIGDGDHSTLSCITADAKGKAVLKIKQDGILAGMQVVEKIFSYKEPLSVFTSFKKDGDAMKVGEKAFEVEALVHTILQCERLVLNCMQRKRVELERQASNRRGKLPPHPKIDLGSAFPSV